MESLDLLIIKMPPYQYSHYKGKMMLDYLSSYEKFNFRDKSVMRSLYLYNWNPYAGKMPFLYWDAPHICEPSARKAFFIYGQSVVGCTESCQYDNLYSRERG